MVCKDIIVIAGIGLVVEEHTLVVCSLVSGQPVRGIWSLKVVRVTVLKV